MEGTYLLRNLEKELLLACQHGHYDAVYELVSHKELIINFQDDYGNTPLHYACWYMEQMADPRISTLLLYYGANPTIYNHNGFFPMIHNPFANSSANELAKDDLIANSSAAEKESEKESEKEPEKEVDASLKNDA